MELFEELDDQGFLQSNEVDGSYGRSYAIRWQIPVTADQANAILHSSNGGQPDSTLWLNIQYTFPKYQRRGKYE